MAEANKAAYGVLEGVLVYAKLAQPDEKYQSKDTEYSVACITDEDTADSWNEQFPKQPAKKIKVGDFEKKYKFECPIEGVKNVYEIKLKKDCVVDGEEVYPEFRPKVFLDTNDGDRLDITESRLIANGSLGKISYRITTNTFGTFARLNNVLVQEDTFKEYVSTGGKAGDEFGSKPVTKEPARKEATQARAAKPEKEEKPEKAVVKGKKAVVEDDASEDAPF